jgi:hypothetical protein
VPVPEGPETIAACAETERVDRGQGRRAVCCRVDPGARQIVQDPADPGGAVVEAVTCVKDRRPSGSAQSGQRSSPGRRLGDPEQEVARSLGGAQVAGVTGHRVGGQQTFADGRRADI